MQLTIPLKLIISLLLGMAIGFERESYEYRVDKTEKRGIGSLGIRSYSLITTLGTIAGILLTENYLSLYIPIAFTFSALLISYYIIGSVFNKDSGITTELAIIWSFVVGTLIALEIMPIQLIVAIVAVMTLILSAKERVKGFVAGVKEFEVQDFISYAIIALVIFPFLPNVSYTLADIPFLSTIFSAYKINLGAFANIEIINFFDLWKVVVLITGIEIFGYILERIVGKKQGWLLASFVGGFISSTSTTQSLANQSKSSSNADGLTAAAVFSNLSSFFQHFILLASINAVFLVKNTLYILALIISGFIVGIFFLVRAKKEVKIEEKDIVKTDIFSLKPALRFALLFLTIKVATKFALVIFGSTGFIVGNLLGAVTGLDAVTINISEVVGKNITLQLGTLALILANAVNLLAKSLYAFVQGSRAFAYRFFISVLIIIAASFIGLIQIF